MKKRSRRTSHNKLMGGIIGDSGELCDEFHHSPPLSIDALRAERRVKFVKQTEDLKLQSLNKDEASFQRGLANAKLSGFNPTPELESICRDFSFGKITLNEAFEAAGICRGFEFQVQVRLPLNMSQEYALLLIEKTCSDAIFGIGKPRHISLAFERRGIILDKVLEQALDDILTSIPEVEILEIRS